MSDLFNDQQNLDSPKYAPIVLVKVNNSRMPENGQRFAGSFLIGRGSECELRITEACVSRRHLQVTFDGERWWLNDLESANGTFMDGVRIEKEPLPDRAEIGLGREGPVLTLTVEREDLPVVEDKMVPAREFATETQIISHYFDKHATENIGERTMMFRRAFERVHRKKSRKYQVLIGTVLALLLSAGGFIVFQTHKLNNLRTMAENIFYTTKSLELQVAKLEGVVLMKADPKQVEELKAKRVRLREMENEYDRFVEELGIYGKRPEDEQIILRVARTFGECDASAPKDFVEEVRRYIQMWKKTDRLKAAISHANQKGYTRLIVRVLKDNDLPSQYVYLPLQESNFDERAIGRETRYGFAKGMWQFISPTASRYGLRTGPLQDQGVYDPFDERFDFVKSTIAATKYIKDLSETEAQASGLLVMASYNWGEDNVREIIRRMPENPRERNFWRLLSYKNIPRETYDYVFSIVSAAAICENPRIFGFDLECPTRGKVEGAGI